MGNVHAVAITLAILFFSIPHGTGEIRFIVSVAAVSVVFPTITVLCPAMLSLMISDTLIVNVQDFLMINPFENTFAP